jgi:hypothetical protein
VFCIHQAVHGGAGPIYTCKCCILLPCYNAPRLCLQTQCTTIVFAICASRNPFTVQVRKPTNVVSTICDDRGEEPTYYGVTMSWHSHFCVLSHLCNMHINLCRWASPLPWFPPSITGQCRPQFHTHTSCMMFTCQHTSTSTGSQAHQRGVHHL